MREYICTNCTRPTPSLYKVYSTPGSIQLTTCKSCHHDVDLYIEREWLLVIMDCILHRPEAFRHILYNREPFCSLVSSGKASDRRVLRYRQILQYSLMTYPLRVCLYIAAFGLEKENPQHGEIGQHAFRILLQLFSGDFILFTSTILTGWLFLRNKAAPRDIAQRIEQQTRSALFSNVDLFFFSKIYLALTIPIFFHTATLAVSIWENSSTISMLGTLFVISLQRMGVAIVMSEQKSNRKIARQYSTNLGTEKIEQEQDHLFSFKFVPESFPFICGLLLCIAIKAILMVQLGKSCSEIPW